jgi:hypothetical protein
VSRPPARGNPLETLYADTLPLPRLKPKAGELPPSVKYFSAVDTPDVWLAYPWECDGDIEEHDEARSRNP